MQEIVTAESTSDDVGDVAVLPEQLDQFDGVAEGAYDVEAAGRAVADRHPAAAVVILLRATAVPSRTTTR